MQCRGFRLLQFCVLGLGLFQNGSIGVRIFPEREEILTRGFCLGYFSRESVRSAQLQVRQRANGIANYNAPMVKNFLELGTCFTTSALSQISLPSYIDGIKRPIEAMDGATRRTQFVRSSRLKQFERFRRIPMQGKLSAKYWQLAEPDCGIFRETLL